MSRCISYEECKCRCMIITIEAVVFDREVIFSVRQVKENIVDSDLP